MTDYIQVYTTTEKREEAKEIARDVVEKRLAACAQVLGPIASTYWWKGMIEEAEEWVCVMKSRRDRYKRLEETIRGIHPYEEPEILAVPIEAGSRGYLNWLDRELGT
jgi:periplasmic divalent cation tolerance protein